MANSKWILIPPLNMKEALKQGIKAGGLILTIGIIMQLLGLRVISLIFILAGLFFMAASPFLFREATIRGYCPNCNRFLSVVFKDQLICPYCKHKIDTSNISIK